VIYVTELLRHIKENSLKNSCYFHVRHFIQYEPHLLNIAFQVAVNTQLKNSFVAQVNILAFESHNVRGLS